MKKKISETTHLNVRDIILKFKHQKAPRIDEITADILQKSGSSFMEEDT